MEKLEAYIKNYTIRDIEEARTKAWNEGYHQGTIDCVADYECGLRKLDKDK